jgi:pyruvate dehydrogenase E2 component (dihydrolipoamide acetyltransferase)
MGINEYKLPDVGEGLTEAEIVTWKVKVGDVIKINDIVVEIETAKSLVELPSPYAGTVSALLVDEGVTVPVGTPIIAVAEAGTDLSAAPAAPAAAPAAAGAEDEPPMQTLVGYGPKETGAARRPRKAAVVSTSSTTATPVVSTRSTVVAPVVEKARPASRIETTTRALAKPPVRKLAKDLGVDLATLAGSGAGGVVTRGDVEAARNAGGVAPAARPAGAARGERREPIKGVRKMMGQAMVDSAFTLPHVTEWITVDVTETMRLVEKLKTSRDFRDVKVSPMLVLARAICLAIRRTPEINAWWDGATQEIVYKDAVNLGIAAATPRGLVVPNVKDADLLDMRGLADAVTELVAVARDGKTQPADMSGGTFTITNVGVFGVDSGTPIINTGESAIIAFGAIRKQPWVHKGKIKVRDVTTLALSFDHRFIDGEKGSRFLADVAAILEDPATALLY